MSCRSEKHPHVECDEYGPFGGCRAAWNAWKLGVAEAAIESLPKTPLRDNLVGGLLVGTVLCCPKCGEVWVAGHEKVHAE